MKMQIDEEDHYEVINDGIIIIGNNKKRNHSDRIGVKQNNEVLNQAQQEHHQDSGSPPHPNSNRNETPNMKQNETVLSLSSFVSSLSSLPKFIFSWLKPWCIFSSIYRYKSTSWIFVFLCFFTFFVNNTITDKSILSSSKEKLSNSGDNYYHYIHLIGDNNIKNNNNLTKKTARNLVPQTMSLMLSKYSNYSLIDTSPEVLISDPFRSLDDIENTYRCLMKNKVRVFFLHMRKAGGTSIRRFFLKLLHRDLFQDNYNLKIFPQTSSPSNKEISDKVSSATESSFSITDKRYAYKSGIAEGNTFNISCFAHEGELILVTNFRHPMRRLLSSYWFEGILPQDFQRLREKKIEEVGEENFPEAISLRNYTKNSIYNYGKNVHILGKRVWVHPDNYYVRTLVDRYRGDRTADFITEDDLHLAKRILASFDMILITEWMNSPEMKEYVNLFFQTNEMELPTSNSIDNSKLYNKEQYDAMKDLLEGFLDFYPLITASEKNLKTSSKKDYNSTILSASRSLEILEKEFRQKTIKLEKDFGPIKSKHDIFYADLSSKIDVDQLKELYELNKYDMELYRFAQHLCQERMQLLKKIYFENISPESKSLSPSLFSRTDKVKVDEIAQQCKNPINSPPPNLYNQSKENDFPYFKKRKVPIFPPLCMEIFYQNPCINVNLFNETGLTKHSPICSPLSKTETKT